jgi:hypothetical protein
MGTLIFLEPILLYQAFILYIFHQIDLSVAFLHCVSHKRTKKYEIFWVSQKKFLSEFEGKAESYFPKTVLTKNANFCCSFEFKNGFGKYESVFLLFM